MSVATGAEGEKSEPSVMTEIDLLAAIVRAAIETISSNHYPESMQRRSAVGRPSTACCRSWLSGWRSPTQRKRAEGVGADLPTQPGRRVRN